MLKIVKAQGEMLKAFFDFSRQAGYTKSEQRYIKRGFLYVQPRSTFFLALEQEKICARIMTWSDENYNRASSGNCGFFGLLDGEGAAYRQLLQAACDAQRRWGNTEMLGPIAPDGSGWFMGQSDSAQPTGAFSGLPDTGQTRALLDEGFAVCRKYDAYTLSVPAVNRYRTGAQAAVSRFDLQAYALKGLFNRTRLRKAVFDVASENKDMLAWQAERLLPFIDSRHSFVIKNRRGKYTGYALSFDGSRPRIATIMTAEGTFRRPTTVLLASLLNESYLKSAAQTVELSVIDHNNSASQRLIGNSGGVYERSHCLYYKKIT